MSASQCLCVCVCERERNTNTNESVADFFDRSVQNIVVTYGREEGGEFLSLFLFTFLKGVCFRIDMLVSVCDLRLTKMVERGRISEKSGKRGEEFKTLVHINK